MNYYYKTNQILLGWDTQLLSVGAHCVPLCLAKQCQSLIVTYQLHCQ